MRVFADANVLVSAAATRGLCADMLREVLAFHELVISEQVLEEVERALRVKLGVEPETAGEYASFLRENAAVAAPGGRLKVRLADQDDLPVLSAAVASGARVFITGDMELLELKRVGKLRIMSPRRFWETVRGSTGSGSR